MNAAGEGVAAVGQMYIRAAVQRVGRFVFRFRDYLAPAGLAIILALTVPEHPFGSEAVNRWVDALGLLVAATGQALRVLVIGYAYIVRGGAGKQLAAPKLVCEGFYAHSRNPMYVGNFLLLSGLAIIYNSRWVYIFGLPAFVGGLLAIIKAEEAFLANKFGRDYEEYCERVNRFLPRLRGLRATMASMTFDWKRVLRKEYGTTFAWVSAAVFLLIWERLVHFGYSGRRNEINRLLLAYLPVVIAYGVVRWLKKSRRLDS
ncbi:MAG: phospholipid methyltransferase [Deltaproteobacteria bacterium]|jgi:protein-S-isoprenylcysteine O-methyltransferase Ste14|nr:phospholipid methyltransferase [Deltaproteobacteria bacterium]